MYLLDTNIFIEAKNRYYGMDFCPAFWDWLKRAHEMGAVFSVVAVKEEILKGDDQLSEWVNLLPENFFIAHDSGTPEQIKKMEAFLSESKYQDSAKSEFRNAADYHLIVQAMQNTAVVVTHEIFDEGAKKIKIPNICAQFGLKYKNPYAMLRQEGARFILPKKQELIG